MGLESSAQWLETALMELAKKMETGIELDEEIISGLVSYCEMASPLDAKEYLDVCNFFPYASTMILSKFPCVFYM